MVAYFEFTTSDIIGDFCFADSFHQLDSGVQDPWMRDMHHFIPFVLKMRCLFDLALFAWVRLVLLAFAVPIREVQIRVLERVRKRIEMGTTHKDMMTHVIGHISEKGDGISIDELAQTSFVLMVAGSETTATTLAGAMYYLLRNENVLEILNSEIRNAFTSDEDITMAKASILTFGIQV
jgi:cytochrome P450